MRIKNKIMNCTLRKQFLIVVLSMMMIFIMTVSVMVIYMSVSYSKYIYKQAEILMQTCVTNIDNEINSLSYKTFTFTVNERVQKQLEKADSYDYKLKASAVGEVSKYFDEMMQEYHYIKGCAVIGNNGECIVANRFDYEALNNKEFIKGIEKEAEKVNGKWKTIVNTEDNSEIYVLRQIRKVYNYDWGKIGILVMEIDKNEFIGNRVWNNVNIGNLIVMNEYDDVIYENSELDKDTLLSIVNSGGDRIKKYNGKHYITFNEKSSGTNWKYINVIPFDTVLAVTYDVSAVILVIIVLSILLLIIVSMWLVKGITVPVKELSESFAQIKAGNIMLENKMDFDKNTKNEIHIFYNEFVRIMNRLDSTMKEKQEVEKNLANTNMRILEMQINPHFLYNTLETVNWMAKRNKEYEISKMVYALGEIMRASIDAELNVITVSKEIELLNYYIDIQSIRYEENLEINMNIPPALYMCEIPKFTLQPIIENAIKYGYEKTGEAVKIFIDAAVDNEKYIITVKNTGSFIDPEIIEKIENGEIKAKGLGIGISNLHKRIQTLYGKEYGIKAENIEKFAVVHIILPFK